MQNGLNVCAAWILSPALKFLHAGCLSVFVHVCRCFTIFYISHFSWLAFPVEWSYLISTADYIRFSHARFPAGMDCASYPMQQKCAYLHTTLYCAATKDWAVGPRGMGWCCCSRQREPLNCHCTRVSKHHTRAATSALKTLCSTLIPVGMLWKRFSQMASFRRFHLRSFSQNTFDLLYLEVSL